MTLRYYVKSLHHIYKVYQCFSKSIINNFELFYKNNMTCYCSLSILLKIYLTTKKKMYYKKYFYKTDKLCNSNYTKAVWSFLSYGYISISSILYASSEQSPFSEKKNCYHKGKCILMSVLNTYRFIFKRELIENHFWELWLWYIKNTSLI